MATPRFTIDRKTGQVICHKEITPEERKRIQIEVLKKQTELHPELLMASK